MKAFLAVRSGFAAAAFFAAVAVAGAQAPATAPSGGFGFGGHRPPMEQELGPLGGQVRFWNNPTIAEKLKLTDDQRKAMDDILYQHRQSLVDLHANAEKAELALEPLINADQLDESRILAQIDQVAQARAELFKANARFLLAIRGKLTSDQWKQVQALRSSRPQMRHNWGQGGPDSRQERRQGPPPPPSDIAPQGAGPEGLE